MERSTKVIFLTIIIVALIAYIVFSNASNPAPAVNRTNSSITAGDSNQTAVISEKVSATELAKHSSKSDCWIAYKGKVYDITAWLPKHPGSADAIAPYCGKSKEFEAAFTGQHGESQVAVLLKEGTSKGDLQ